MPGPASEYANATFLDRVTEVLIEFEVMRQALETNGVHPKEILSYLSEHGMGDEVSMGRVAGAANRLQTEGRLIEKNGFLKLAPEAKTQTLQAANLLGSLAPREPLRAPESAEETLP